MEIRTGNGDLTFAEDFPPVQKVKVTKGWGTSEDGQKKGGAGGGTARQYVLLRP